MSLIGKTVDAIDELFDNFGKGIKSSVQDYCDLETADLKYTFVARDGSLLTVIEILGVNQMVNQKYLYSQIIKPLKENTEHSFKNPGHKIQVVFESDPDRTKTELEQSFLGSRETAKRLNLDFQDLIDEEVSNLSKYIKSQHLYFVFWTTNELLSKSEKKKALDSRTKTLKKLPKLHDNDQDPTLLFDLIKNRHDAFVNNMNTQLGYVGIQTKLLDVIHAARIIRNELDPSILNLNKWEPSLPDRVEMPVLNKKKIDSETWDVLWPTLSSQLCENKAKILNGKYVRLGHYDYAPIFVKLFSSNPKPFNLLIDNLRVKGIPWRVSFLIESGGLDSLLLKSVIASVLLFSNRANNKLLADSIDALKLYKEEDNGAVVAIRASLCTWSKKGKLSELERKLAELKEALEAWGCQASEITGDPMAGLSSSILAFTRGNIGVKSAAPYDLTLAMLPLTMPTSPFPEGSVILRTPDERMMPIESYSKYQASWVSIIFAKPGFGKSFFLNLLNFGLVLKSGIESLPRIAILDIGPSSSGFVLTVKEALPDDKKHYAVYKKLRNVPEDSINLFDLPLGSRYPNSSHFSFLVNWLTLILTDLSKKEPDEGMTGMVTAVIQEMYLYRSDKRSPNIYKGDVNLFVDQAIKKSRLKVEFGSTSWFDVVDHLSVNGFIKEAHFAQKYTLPILSDASHALNSPTVKSEYNHLIDKFGRSLNEAIRNYHFLRNHSSLDFSEARIVSIDLDELSKGGGPAAERLLEVAYLTVLFPISGDYYMDEDTVEEMPTPLTLSYLLRESTPVDFYKKFHKEKISKTKGEPKRICFDELWRIKNADMVKRQLENNVRVGRKYKVESIFASQYLEDFSNEIRKSATSIYIMAPPSPEEKSEIARAFSIESESENEAIVKSVRGPSNGNFGVFLAKIQTDRWYSALMSAPAGPIKYWASTTTVEDTEVRKRLYEKFGGKIARKLLSTNYPYGIKSEVENRQRNKKKENSFSDDDSLNNSIYDEILNEMAEQNKY